MITTCDHKTIGLLMSHSNLSSLYKHRMMNVNTRSVFYLTQLAIPHLKKTQGNVVNVSSVCGLR